MLKLASWNVNSLKVRLDQVLAWLDTTNVDILALQETKLIDDHFPKAVFTEKNYHVVYTGEKTYNGVAIVSRFPITDVITSLPHWADNQRRLITVTTAGLRLINLYVPNGAALGCEKYDYKLLWFNAMAIHIKQELAAHEFLAVLGDFNVAPQDEDVHDPSVWQDCVLVSLPERQAFANLLGLGLQDSFRLFPQEEKSFSWWDYRAGCFRRNHGLRIDHILLNDALSRRCRASQIDKAPRRSARPSDHAPVWVELDLLPAGQNFT